MSMGKKEFIALADALRSSKPSSTGANGLNSYESAQWESDVMAIARICRHANPRFMLSRWLGYIHGECGPSGGTIKE